MNDHRSTALRSKQTYRDGSEVSPNTVLANAVAVSPLLRARADEAEAARRLSDPVVAALRSTGVFRMWMPRAWGGLEFDIIRSVEVIETLARADASAAWCAHIGSADGFFASYLDETVARSLYTHLDAITVGTLAPSGTLTPCSGGYRLSGRWSFATGVTHADVVMAGAVVADGSDRQRVAALAVEDIEILDTWNPTGLRGTGSHDYSVHDLFVPESHTWVHGEHRRTEPLFAWRGLFTAGQLGVALGVALEACDVVSGFVTERAATTGPSTSESPTIRAAVAKAQAMTLAARSYAYDTLHDLWGTLTAGDQPGFGQRARYAGCLIHTMSSALSAVETLADAVGTASIRVGGPLERALRDLLTLSRHRTTQSRMWEVAGGLAFGETPSLPYL